MKNKIIIKNFKLNFERMKNNIYNYRLTLTKLLMK